MNVAKDWEQFFVQESSESTKRANPASQRSQMTGAVQSTAIGGSRKETSCQRRIGPTALAARPPSIESREDRLIRIFEQNYDFVWRLLRRFGLDSSDADDAAQETFMIVLAKIDAIESEFERSYLYGTALRVSRNAQRRRTKARAMVPVAADSHVSPEPQPDAATEHSQRCSLLDAILAELPGELARIVVLAEIECVSSQQIAQLEGIPVGTVSSRLRKGRELLKKKLERRRSGMRGVSL